MGPGTASQEVETSISKRTILTFAWAVVLLFWSIFTEPRKTFAARIVLFQPLWIVRVVLGESTWGQDLGMFLSLHGVYSLQTGAWKAVTLGYLKTLDVSDEAMKVYIQVFALLGGCGILAAAIVYRGRQLNIKESSVPIRRQSIEDSVLPPLLITSRTSHSRLIPQKHSFSYSYLLAGVPVGLQGRVSSVLSVDSQYPAWFDIRSRDYLDRGSDRFGLGERLKRYLHSQGVTDRNYSFAYLVTAPKFLGYSFNPVSFWYIYDSDTNLKYMVLEVNNTFDERRMYLLHADSAKEIDAISEANDSSARPTKTLVFAEIWGKDFHVSPFNSRKGSYSLRAADPLAAYQETGHVRIDNTIVLRSSKDQPKIVARIWSEGTPVDPNQVTSYQLVKLVAGWWWVGLATFPRIVWEAQKLFFQRKLHVWNRPETAASSIGRTYSDDERSLEEFFRAFLSDSVEYSRKPLRVIYEPAHNEGGEIVLYSPDFTYEEDQGNTLTIKVLTPSFYSRFVHYAHTKEAFDRECLATDEKNRTLLLQGVNALPTLLDAISATAHAPPQRTTTPNPIECMQWNVLQRLRCPPAAASYPSDMNRLDSKHAIQDIRSFRNSEWDRYLQRSSSDSAAYRRVAVKLFLAERAALGIPALIVLWDWAFRSLCILCAMCFADMSNTFDILRPRTLVRADLLNTGFLLLAANLVHIWSFLKS